MAKPYTQEMIKKALSLDLKLIRNKDEENYIVFHVPTTSSKNKSVYKLTYDKHRDEFNCECERFMKVRRCTHVLKAIAILKGKESFFKEIDKYNK